MVHESNAKSTDFISPEKVDDLCAKTKDISEKWAARAEPLWKENREAKAAAKAAEAKKAANLFFS
jgi:hypothetical protein